MNTNEMKVAIEKARAEANQAKQNKMEELRLQAQLNALQNTQLQEAKAVREIKQSTIDAIKTAIAIVSTEVDELALVNRTGKQVKFYPYTISARYGKTFEMLTAYLSGLTSLSTQVREEILPMTGISEMLLSEIQLALPKSAYYVVEEDRIEEGHTGNVKDFVNLLPDIAEVLKVDILQFEANVPQSLFDERYQRSLDKANETQKEFELANANWEADEENDLRIDLS